LEKNRGSNWSQEGLSRTFLLHESIVDDFRFHGDPKREALLQGGKEMKMGVDSLDQRVKAQKDY